MHLETINFALFPPVLTIKIGVAPVPTHALRVKYLGVSAEVYVENADKVECECPVRAEKFYEALRNLDRYE